MIDSPLIQLPDDLSDEVEAELHEEAYIELCELVSPNAPEFDNLLDILIEDKLEKAHRDTYKAQLQ